MARRSAPFARIALDYADHPKIAGLSDAAFRAHIEMILYARKYKTDGQIPKRIAKRYASETLSELLSNDDSAPSLDVDSDGDYWLHDFTAWQETKSEIEARSEVNRRSGAIGGRNGKRIAKRDAKRDADPTKPAEEEEEEEIEEEAKASSRARKRATTPAEDFRPSPTALAWQREHHPDVNVVDETERFINHHRAKGSKFVDHDAAWRNWIKNSVKFAAEQPRRLNPVLDQTWTPPPGSPLSYVEM